jgi:XTP/dITP diphosphohydrolase
MRRVVLATRSAGKLRELGPLLREAGFEPATLTDLGIAEEPGEEEIEAFGTFAENSLAKARYFYERCGGLPILADDSGLEVIALGGRPGVQSKRWAQRGDLSGQTLDDANNAKLLEELQGFGDRSARYVCEATWVDAHSARSARGEVSGSITQEAKGRNGFGYDPYFFSSELGKTFGEATIAEKARVSHRARAVRSLLRLL